MRSVKVALTPQASLLTSTVSRANESHFDILWRNLSEYGNDGGVLYCRLCGVIHDVFGATVNLSRVALNDTLVGHSTAVN